MSLRKKILLIIGATLLGLIALLYASSRTILLQSFIDLETDNVHQSVRRHLQSFSHELATLTAVAEEWATREDNYRFVQDANQDYIAAYLADSAFITARLNLIMFVDSSGTIIYQQGFDLDYQARLSVPTGLDTHFQPDSVLLQHANSASRISGILVLPRIPVLIVAVPIVTDAAPDAIQGTLVLGRYLEHTEIQQLAEVNQSLLSLHRINDRQLPTDVKTARVRLSSQQDIFVQPLGEQFVVGYGLLHDIYGNPALILKLQLTRHIYDQGRASLWYFMLALIFSGIVFGVMILLMFEQTILSRLTKLSTSVKQIELSSDPSRRVSLTGKDELGQLAGAVNGMLVALDRSQKTLRSAETAEYEQRKIAEALRDTAAALTGTLNFDEVLDRILMNVEHVVPYDATNIMLIEAGVASVARSRGYTERGLTDRIKALRLELATVPNLQQVVETGQALIISDTRMDANWVELPEMGWVRACITIPIRLEEQIIGLLNLNNATPDFFTAQHAEWLKTFADQAALAMENARILAELETRVEELHSAQNQLVRTTRLSVAGEIAAGVAHQINNPLTTIVAEIHLILQQLDPEDNKYEAAEAIRAAATRAGKVVQRLLNLTRTHAYDMQPLDINKSLQASIALIRAQIEPHNVTLELTLTPDLPYVDGSQQHLEDVWINILLNARDAISGVKSGMITITSSLNPAGDAIEVMIQDNGPGLSPEHKERIFEPFFTTKSYGTGLGLSICHDVITQHHGDIRVDSTAGQGTTFIITLPLNTNAI